MSDGLRIYAACLASYNNGRLHGAWIDASADAGEMQNAINDMLAASPCPNVMRRKCDHCGAYQTDARPYGENDDECDECGAALPDEFKPSAEEWAIHDYDGRVPSGFGEYPSLSTIVEYVELLEAFDYMDCDDMAAIVDNWCGDVGEAKSALEDNYCGSYGSFREYSDELADESLACHEIGEEHPLRNYFDYESYANDLRHGMSIVELPSGGVAVFHA